MLKDTFKYKNAEYNKFADYVLTDKEGAESGQYYDDMPCTCGNKCDTLSIAIAAAVDTKKNKIVTPEQLHMSYKEFGRMAKKSADMIPFCGKMIVRIMSPEGDITTFTSAVFPGPIFMVMLPQAREYLAMIEDTSISTNADAVLAHPYFFEMMNHFPEYVDHLDTEDFDTVMEEVVQHVADEGHGFWNYLLNYSVNIVTSIEFNDGDYASNYHNEMNVIAAYQNYIGIMDSDPDMLSMVPLFPNGIDPSVTGDMLAFASSLSQMYTIVSCVGAPYVIIGNDSDDEDDDDDDYDKDEDGNDEEDEDSPVKAYLA